MAHLRTLLTRGQKVDPSLVALMTPYAVTPDPKGRTFDRYCGRCGAGLKHGQHCRTCKRRRGTAVGSYGRTYVPVAVPLNATPCKRCGSPRPVKGECRTCHVQKRAHLMQPSAGVI